MSRCRCPGSVPVPLSRLCPGSVPVPLSRLRPGAAVPVLFVLDPVQVYEEAVKPLDRARARRTIASTAARCGGARPSLTTARVAGVTRDHTHTGEVETSTCLDVVVDHDRISAADEKWIQVSGIIRFQVCPFSDPFQIRFRSIQMH